MSDDPQEPTLKRMKLPDSVIEVFKDVAREFGVDYDPDAPPSEAVEHWLTHGSPYKKVIPSGRPVSPGAILLNIEPGLIVPTSITCTLCDTLLTEEQHHRARRMAIEDHIVDTGHLGPWAVKPVGERQDDVPPLVVHMPPYLLS